MHNKQKELVCSGCSWTEHTKVSYIDKNKNTDFERWPEILAKKLGLKSVNLGKSGANNDYIHLTLTQYIVENYQNIDIVCVLWTNWLRYGFLNTQFRYLEIIHNWGHDNIDVKYLIKQINDMSESDRAQIIPNIIKHHILNIFMPLQLLCHKYNIKILYMQGLSPLYLSGYMTDLLRYDRHLVYDYIEQYEKYFNKKIFHGWPLYKDLNGYAISNIINYNQYHISEEDRHPNYQGHELIADMFLDDIHLTSYEDNMDTFIYQ